MPKYVVEAKRGLVHNPNMDWPYVVWHNHNGKNKKQGRTHMRSFKTKAEAEAHAAKLNKGWI